MKTNWKQSVVGFHPNFAWTHSNSAQEEQSRHSVFKIKFVGDTWKRLYHMNFIDNFQKQMISKWNKWRGRGEKLARVRDRRPISTGSIYLRTVGVERRWGVGLIIIIFFYCYYFRGGNTTIRKHFGYITIVQMCMVQSTNIHMNKKWNNAWLK